MAETAQTLVADPGPALTPLPRVVPFVPRGLKRPLVFLHIPKTSGSSCNRLLADLYGADNFIAHAEYRLPRLLSRRAPSQVADGISAHVPLCRWSLYAGSGAYGRVTMLRDPWPRLVSHINWLARFLQGHRFPKGETSLTLRRVVEALGQTDFDSRDSLLRFMAVVRREVDGFNAFDNLQVRMTILGHPRATYRPVIGGAEVAQAIANISAFDLVGVCEDQDTFRDRLVTLVESAEAPAEPPRENVGKLRLLSVDNGLAREMFAPWVALDQQLYDAARQL